MKKMINSRMDAWQNGCFSKMDDHLVHTIPNHHPPKIDVLPKITFIQIILAAKWLVWHSSTSPKQQRRPLPSLLSVSSAMILMLNTILEPNPVLCPPPPPPLCETKSSCYTCVIQHETACAVGAFGL